MSLDVTLNITAEKCITYLFHNSINTILLLNTNRNSQQVTMAIIIDLNQNNHPKSQKIYVIINTVITINELWFTPHSTNNLAIIYNFLLLRTSGRARKNLQNYVTHKTIRILPLTLTHLSTIKALALNLTSLVLCHEVNCPTFWKSQKYPRGK